jgi:hypothetical protein
MPRRTTVCKRAFDAQHIAQNTARRSKKKNILHTLTHTLSLSLKTNALIVVVCAAEVEYLAEAFTEDQARQCNTLTHTLTHIHTHPHTRTTLCHTSTPTEKVKVTGLLYRFLQLVVRWCCRMRAAVRLARYTRGAGCACA